MLSQNPYRVTPPVEDDGRPIVDQIEGWASQMPRHWYGRAKLEAAAKQIRDLAALVASLEVDHLAAVERARVAEERVNALESTLTETFAEVRERAAEIEDWRGKLASQCGQTLAARYERDRGNV